MTKVCLKTNFSSLSLSLSLSFWDTHTHTHTHSLTHLLTHSQRRRHMHWHMHTLTNAKTVSHLHTHSFFASSFHSQSNAHILTNCTLSLSLSSPSISLCFHLLPCFNLCNFSFFFLRRKEEKIPGSLRCKKAATGFQRGETNFSKSTVFKKRLRRYTWDILTLRTNRSVFEHSDKVQMHHLDASTNVSL